MKRIQCGRCGEPNHGDARYCGSCGDALPVAGGIASLVSEDPLLVEQATTLAASTQHVEPPAFGETGPAVTSAVRASPAQPTAVVTQPDGATHGQTASNAAPMGAERTPSRSVRVMIAAVVVAVIVIVGGLSILMASGSSGDENARPDTSEPLAASTDAEVAAVESSVVDDLETVETVPTEVIVTSQTGTSETVATETTSPPPPPTRGPGDLGLTQPILDEECDGRYVTFVGSAIGDRPYSTVVDELLDLYPGTNYVWTKACPSLRQEFSDGADIYGVVFGPYATQQEACDARAFGPQDAYVRRISTSDPEDHTVSC